MTIKLKPSSQTLYGFAHSRSLPVFQFNATCDWPRHCSHSEHHIQLSVMGLTELAVHRAEMRPRQKEKVSYKIFNGLEKNLHFKAAIINISAVGQMTRSYGKAVSRSGNLSPQLLLTSYVYQRLAFSKHDSKMKANVTPVRRWS